MPVAQVPKQEAPQITWFECKSTESWSIGSGKTQRLPESSRDLSLKEDMKKKIADARDGVRVTSKELF